MELKKLIQKRWKSSVSDISESVREELEKYSKKWKDYIDEKIGLKSRIKILDTCCGPGFLSILLSGNGRKIIGVDECEEMLEEARKNADMFGASVNFLKMDCHKLEFMEGTFDMVVSRNSLWTMYNPGEAYKDWVRVLKPGGRIVIFESSWCLEYKRRDIMETKRNLRKQYNLPAQDTTYFWGDNSLAQELDVRSMLGNVERPDWDFKVLDKLKMDIEIDTDAWKYIWIDEDKKLYGYAPMFMINAKKRK